jgi:hypothetical protein
MGSTHYEFQMQVRRPAVWITFLLFSLLLMLTGLGGFGNLKNLGMDTPLDEVVTRWATMIQMFMPIAFGILLADRLPRDRRTRVGELFDTLPAPAAGRLVGKYVGSTLATLVPLVVVYASGLGYLLVKRGDPWVLPLGLAAFATINLPGLMFVAAFSVAVPVVLWVPLYQCLFVGYWFWGTMLPPEGAIPTLSGTWIEPAGRYALLALWYDEYAAWEGLASIGLLLALGALALLGAHWYLRWAKVQQ